VRRDHSQQVGDLVRLAEEAVTTGIPRPFPVAFHGMRRDGHDRQVGLASLISRVASRPSISGSDTSIITRSGRPLPASSTATRPSAASSTW